MNYIHARRFKRSILVLSGKVALTLLLPWIRRHEDFYRFTQFLCSCTLLPSYTKRPSLLPHPHPMGPRSSGFRESESRREIRLHNSPTGTAMAHTLNLSTLYPFSHARHVRHACVIHTGCTWTRTYRGTPPKPRPLRAAPPPPRPLRPHTRESCAIGIEESQGPSTHPPKSKATGPLQPGEAV